MPEASSREQPNFIATHIQEQAIALFYSTCEVMLLYSPWTGMVEPIENSAGAGPA